MNVSIAAYVEEQKTGEPPGSVHIVRPLFFHLQPERDASLQRAINKLARTLKNDFERLSAQSRHDQISANTFNPEMDSHLLKITVPLGNRRYDCRFLFVTFEGFGRKIVFTPNIADLWFEIKRGETLIYRAEEAVEFYFRELERKYGKGSQNPDYFSIKEKAWITSLEIDIHIPQLAPKKTDSFFALLGGAEVMSGAQELNRVGRCLDWLYPNELDRVVRRENEVENLTKLLDPFDRRPVLITGARLVGKTALIHEYVYRTTETRRSAHMGMENVWLLAPQRLISGMSYLGQWEKRLLAIIDEARYKKHILYFDDLPGLFQAGMSASSNLNVAQVLKPYLERKEVRFLGEITPESLRVLKEKDRGFADLFQIVRVEEPKEEETLRILLSVVRQLEQQHSCKFEFEALPTVIDLQRRYVRDASFPGKAAVFLRRLAVKKQNAIIKRENVLEEFQAASGMSVSFLDDRAKLERKTIIDAISKNLIGQTESVSSAADVITTAKARLNDPTRPLASFLFLGPTGTGKTECAKQISAYLYGAEERLLRFDMNEFVSSYDVSRLVGTFDQPEGLLTSAIRRQPFSVVLFDEIEKAHPDVFNLLLQVMGDGRLTDALGRTTDFTNTILILTSNLGAREAGKSLGYRQSETSESHTYKQAAEKFFKPEFFNRLDRVIPFEKLKREDVEKIALRLIQNVFSRDGLIRRNCKLMVHKDAMEHVINQGYHPQLGDRALKRAIEKQLTQPVAMHLASLNPNASTIINLLPDGENISVQVEELKPHFTDERYFSVLKNFDADELLDLIADTLDRIEDDIKEIKPKGEIIIGDQLQRTYALLRESIQRVERMIGRADDWLEKTKRKKSSQPSSSRSKRHLLIFENEADLLAINDLLNVSDPIQSLRDFAEKFVVYGEHIEHYLQDILRELSLLNLFAAHNKQETKTVSLSVQPFDETGNIMAEWLARSYTEFFNQELGLETKLIKDTFSILIKGVHALPLVESETGTHIFLTAHSGFIPLQVSVAESKQESFPPVVRIYHAEKTALDFRTGLMANEQVTIRELRAFILSALPLPKEIMTRRL